MFKINHLTVQNKCTVEKFGPEKIIAQYLIKDRTGGKLGRKNYFTCTIIRYPRVWT